MQYFPYTSFRYDIEAKQDYQTITLSADDLHVETL